MGSWLTSGASFYVQEVFSLCRGIELELANYQTGGLGWCCILLDSCFHMQLNTQLKLLKQKWSLLAHLSEKSIHVELLRNKLDPAAQMMSLRTCLLCSSLCFAFPRSSSSAQYSPGTLILKYFKYILSVQSYLVEESLLDLSHVSVPSHLFVVSQVGKHEPEPCASSQVRNGISLPQNMWVLWDESRYLK